MLSREVICFDGSPDARLDGGAGLLRGRGLLRKAAIAYKGV